MNLLNRVLQDFQSFSLGAIDVEHLQKRVEASVSAMDGSVPNDLREMLEKFVRDAEVARFTTSAKTLDSRIRELAEPVLIGLKAHIASGD